MSESIYVVAVNTVPKGETRSFGEIAGLAGKPSAARAAGRALTSYPVEGRAAWQRAVTASGDFSVDPLRADWQLQRLRADGARPRENESIERWSKRVGAAVVGNWRNGQCFARHDPRVSAIDPHYVERFADETAAFARGFTPQPSLDPTDEAPRARRKRIGTVLAPNSPARARTAARAPHGRTQPPPGRRTSSRTRAKSKA